MPRSLLSKGLVEEVPAAISDAIYAWRRGEDGTVLMLRATPAGLAAIGLTEAPTDAPTLPDTAEEDAVAREAAAVVDALDSAPTAPARGGLRQVEEAVFAAWIDEANREIDTSAALKGPLATLRIALARKPARPTGTSRGPRVGTKQQALLMCKAACKSF